MNGESTAPDVLSVPQPPKPQTPEHPALDVARDPVTVVHPVS